VNLFKGSLVFFYEKLNRLLLQGPSAVPVFRACGQVAASKNHCIRANGHGTDSQLCWHAMAIQTGIHVVRWDV